MRTYVSGNALFPELKLLHVIVVHHFVCQYCRIVVAPNFLTSFNWAVPLYIINITV